jgi:hypothetical protein
MPTASSQDAWSRAARAPQDRPLIEGEQCATGNLSEPPRQQLQAVGDGEPPILTTWAGLHISLYVTALQLGVAANGSAARTPFDESAGTSSSLAPSDAPAQGGSTRHLVSEKTEPEIVWRLPSTRDGCFILDSCCGKGRGAERGRGRGRTAAAGVLFDLNESTFVGTMHEFLAGLVELGATSGAEYEAIMQARGDAPIPEDGLPDVPIVACVAGHGWTPTPGGAYAPYVTPLLPGDPPPTVMDDLCRLPYVPHVACVAGHGQPPTPESAYVPYATPLSPGEPTPTVMDDLVGGTSQPPAQPAATSAAVAAEAPASVYFSTA